MYLYYQNVRGINTKLDVFVRNVSLFDYDIIVLSETWLRQEVNDSELGLLPNYSIFRCDRCSVIENDIRGGGVLIAIKNHYHCSQITIHNNNIEQLFVKLTIGSTMFIIGAVYIPPHSSLNVYNNHTDIINNLLCQYNNSKIVLLGDYNLPAIQWSSVSDGVVSHFGKLEADALANFSYLNLKQFNTIKNHKNSILDLVLSNSADVCVAREQSTLVPIDYLYHPALLISTPIYENNEPLYYNESKYDYVNCDYNIIRSSLANVNWDLVFKDLHINEAVNIFYYNVFKTINSNCNKITYFASKHPIWFSSFLKNLIYRKKIAHMLYKQNPSQSNYNIFSNLRAQCKSRSKLDYNNYTLKIQSSINFNPKIFWKFVNQKNKLNSSFPNTMTYNSSEISGGNDIVNCFASYFSSVYDNSLNTPTSINKLSSTFSNNIVDINLHSCTLNITDVLNEFDTINNKTCPGPDMISNLFFIQCKFVLAVPLLYLFNLSISSGVFPSEWKISHITPIKKGNDLSNILNYRPISLISIIPKIFESLVSKQIYPILAPIVNEDQHGFIKGKSTTTNLLIFQAFILDAFATGCQVDVIYTDFSKAFDKVNHSYLFEKLFAIGIRDPMLSWLISYVTNRKQIVKVKNFTSCPFSIPSGVPQGSHLAPLLFILFINDLHFDNSNKLLFADDVKFFRVIKSSSDSVLLQNDLNRLSIWCKRNKLMLNVDKCKVMSFSRSRYPVIHNYYLDNILLNRVVENLDLGITFSSNLTFNKHYLNISKKSSSILGFISRTCKDFTNSFTLKILYFSLVRSILEYNSIIWSPSTNTHIQSLEGIQNRFLRFVSYKCNIPRQRHTPYKPLLDTLNMNSLEIRRNIIDLKFLYKVLNGFIYSSEILNYLNFYVPKCQTRSTNTFYLKLQKTNYLNDAPINRIMRLANDTQVDFFSFNSVESFNYFIINYYL